MTPENSSPDFSASLRKSIGQNRPYDSPTNVSSLS